MLIIAGFLVAVVGVGVLSRHFVDGPITPPAVMITVGLVTALLSGTTGPATATTILVAEVTLSLVLFVDASRIAPSMLRHATALPGRLLGIGLPLSMALITGCGMLFLQLELGPALLLGAALSATDAALASIIVESDSLPRRLRQAINVESGLNDGLASPLVTIAIAIMLDTMQTFEGVVVETATLVVGSGLLGAAVGTAGGWLLRWGRQRDSVDATWAQLATLGVVGLVTALAMALGVITFVAAFVGGLAFRSQMGDAADEVSGHTEDTAQFMTAAAFFLFGLLLPDVGLGGITIGDIAFALFALTIGRMLPVAISLIGTDDSWQTTTMIGWFGPRGLATVLFALIAIEEAGGAIPVRATWVLVLTVLSSVVAHGVTAAPLTRTYVAWLKRRSAKEPVDPMSHPIGESIPVGRTRG